MKISLFSGSDTFLSEFFFDFAVFECFFLIFCSRKMLKGLISLSELSEWWIEWMMFLNVASL